MKYSWPLSTSSFSIWDKINISKFILLNDKYTMGTKVEELEEKFSQLTKSKSLFVSSGSTANQLMFETWKQLNQDKFENTVVIAPSTTWISSVSPAIMAGFEVQFCDINLQDLSFDYIKLRNLVSKLSRQKKHIIVYPTCLIGFSPNFSKLWDLTYDFSNLEILLDNCEGTLTSFRNQNICGLTKMSTTSTFFSHLCVSIEGGFLFCQNDKEYEVAKMIRSHGMSRALDKNSKLRQKIESDNKNIDNRFLFEYMGTNLRNSEIHAVFGLKDFSRIPENIKIRKLLYNKYLELIDKNKYLTIENLSGDVPFCIPIISKDSEQNQKVKKKLEENGIETRPIIAFLPIAPAFKSFNLSEKDFPNSNFLHENGCYVGLHSNLKVKDINKLTTILN